MKKTYTFMRLIAVTLIALASSAVPVRAAMIEPIDVEGVVGIFAVFGMPVMIVAIILYFKHRRNKLAHETIRAMIDKGMPITPELVAQIRGKGWRDGKGYGGSGRLLPGLVLAGIGTALLITGSRHSIGGWIVLFIGVAFLVVWAMEWKNQSNAQPPKL
jgi:hypothetical protein